MVSVSKTIIIRTIKIITNLVASLSLLGRRMVLYKWMDGCMYGWTIAAIKPFNVFTTKRGFARNDIECFSRRGVSFLPLQNSKRTIPKKKKRKLFRSEKLRANL